MIRKTKSRIDSATGTVALSVDIWQIRAYSVCMEDTLVEYISDAFIHLAKSVRGIIVGFPYTLLCWGALYGVWNYSFVFLPPLTALQAFLAILVLRATIANIPSEQQLTEAEIKLMSASAQVERDFYNEIKARREKGQTSVAHEQFTEEELQEISDYMKQAGKN